MPLILVTPLSAVEATIRSDRPSHLVTLLSPEHLIDTPAGFAPEKHLRLGMNDVADEYTAEAPPSPQHVERLLEFGRGWDAGAPLLVHCWAGVSRSMAAAYILLCERAGPGHERAIAEAIRARAPHAAPNTLMVRYADEALGRAGRMRDAVEAIGRGRIVDEGVRVELPLTLHIP